jgi:hypothetical protein
MKSRQRLTVPAFMAAMLGAVAIGCGPQGPPRLQDDAVKLPPNLPIQRTGENVAIGDDVNTSGNSFSRGVSAQFGEPELRRLYLQLNGPAVKSKLRSYVCPAALPAFRITVVLSFEGSYQERLVRLQMTPPLYKQDGRIEGGIGYLFQQAIKALDKGPPIDYGYRHTLDGSKVVPRREIDTYQEPEAHDCGSPGDEESSESVTDFLLTSAATDFHTHRPPDPVRFRGVRVGRLMTPAGAPQYLLCGQFLPAAGGATAEWTPFATIKTSGYEQWLGARAAGFCGGSSVVWENQSDLSSSLQARLDALRQAAAEVVRMRP